MCVCVCVCVGRGGVGGLLRPLIEVSHIFGTEFSLLVHFRVTLKIRS